MKARPTDLEAIDSSLLSIQDEFREHFGWGLAADLESAHALRAAIEESNVDIWSRAQRARTVAALHRRLVLRATDIALLGAAVTTAEIETALTDNTLLIAADGATGVLSTLPDSLAERAWSRLACVVSDADGGEGTVAAVKRGIPMILHAHGDNTDAWTELLALASSRRTPPRSSSPTRRPSQSPECTIPAASRMVTARPVSLEPWVCRASASDYLEPARTSSESGPAQATPSRSC